MNTKFWGAPGWDFLHTITFNYPEKIDKSNKDDVERMKYTKRLFNDLQYTLPCKYCRQSYKEFLKQEPIEPNLDSRQAITHWFYRVHNLVNDKLRKQELEAVDKRTNELEADVSSGKLTSKQAHKILKEFVHRTMITEKDPQFSDVCAKYEAQRASCAKPKDGIASCRSNDRTPDRTRRSRR